MIDNGTILFKRAICADGSFYDSVASFDRFQVDAARLDGWKETLDEQQPSDQGNQSGQPVEQLDGNKEHQKQPDDNSNGLGASKSEPVGDKQPIRSESKSEKPAATGKRGS
jgi:hypothetical protein